MKIFQQFCADIGNISFVGNPSWFFDNRDVRSKNARIDFDDSVTRSLLVYW